MSNKYNYDVELARFFTDFDYLQQVFKELVVAPTLRKHILVIHGVGGIGKTSLLRMYRLTCKGEKIPVALASGDDTKSAIEVLAQWSSDLKDDKVSLRTFSKGYEHYRELQAKVDEQVQKAKATRDKALDVASKAASKTAEAAGGAALGAAIGSLIPGIGTVVGSALGGILGGLGTETLIEWLREFLTKSDVDFLLEPTKILSEYFLEDLTRVAAKRRLVLMLDTYEQMAALEDWGRELAKQLHGNILLVIAGRTIPNWNRAWPEWMIPAQIEEVKPMSEELMRDLVRNYYATMRGGIPNPEQVEAIIRFSRGLPMVVTSAVRLWVQYGIEDFQAVKPQVVADLVDRLLEGVPAKIIPLMRAAATVRWFNQPILRAVAGQEDVESAYDELRRFPFVRSRAEGLMFHDAVREFMDDNFKVQDSERYRECHHRAAMYFGEQINNSNAIPGLSDEWQRLALEEAYHLLLSDEEAGADFLHTSFGHGLTYFRYQFCRQLLNDGEALNLSNKKTLHRIKFNKIRLIAAEFSPAYMKKQDFDEIVSQCDQDPVTKWQVLLSYAGFLGFTTAQPELEAEYCRQSLNALKSIGQEETNVGCLVLKEVARFSYDEPLKAEGLLRQAVKISENIQQPFFAYEPYIELGHLYLAQGKYSEAENMWKAAVKIAESFQNDSLIANAHNRLAHAYMAQERLDDAERVLISAMEAAKRLPDTLGAGKDKIMYIKRHFGMLHQMQKEYYKAITFYSESAQTYRERKSLGGRSRTLILLAGCLYEAGLHEELKSLMPEMDDLMPKVGIKEVIAAWHTLRGHLALDDVIANGNSLHGVTTLYAEALKTSIEGAVQGVVPLINEILNRIFWKLSLVDKDNHERVILILNALKDFWSNTKMEGKFLFEVEVDKRRKFFGFNPTDNLSSQVLDELNFALTNDIPQRKPLPWWAY